MTMSGVMMQRKTIYQLEKELKNIRIPTLVMIGDEDSPCVNPAIFMKRNIPGAGLAVFPQAGHTINLEEPEFYNRTVSEFLISVEAGKWVIR